MKIQPQCEHIDGHRGRRCPDSAGYRVIDVFRSILHKPKLCRRHAKVVKFKGTPTQAVALRRLVPLVDIRRRFGSEDDLPNSFQA